MVEQGTFNPEVQGSNPCGGTEPEKAEQQESRELLTVSNEELAFCGHSSMVEPQPSKLRMRVRFPLPALNNLLRTDSESAHVE